jgi:hypothetical protein
VRGHAPAEHLEELGSHLADPYPIEPVGAGLGFGYACWAARSTLAAMAKPSPGAFRANWDNSDLPFLEKLAVAARNQAIKVATGSSCCGHHGEPGC